METTESTKLVLAIKNGNTKAFNYLVNHWYQKIYNYALKFMGDHDKAMEVTQKTFIAVHQHIGKLKEAQLFKSWLYQIAINYCKEEGRKQQRQWIFPFVSFRKQDNQFTDVQDAATPQVNLEQEELNELLIKALAALPEEQRAVVIMKEYEGLKFKEIAQVLNISENTAKSRMYYGLKHLKQTFDTWNIKKENTYYEH